MDSMETRRALEHAKEYIEKNKAIIDAGKSILGDIVDFVYDRVMERHAEHHPITYVYPAAYKPDKDGYAGGEAGIAVLDAAVPVTIIDFVTVAKACGFSIDQFYIGDQNMLLGCSELPADMFFPRVMNRGVRFTELKAQQQSIVHFHNRTTDPTPIPFMVAAKVRSEFLPDSFMATPTDGPTPADAPAGTDDKPLTED